MYRCSRVVDGEHCKGKVINLYYFPKGRKVRSGKGICLKCKMVWVLDAEEKT